MTRGHGGAATPEAAGAPVEVRHCCGLDQFEACVELQRRVWGAADRDVVPLPLFVVAAETGGQVLGAFVGTRAPKKMVGFTMALAAVHQRRPFLHSHMTAVLEEYRDRGVGRQLKLFQRQDALDRGIELVEWTFDPLELKNGYFNLVRLGAIVRRYLPNCYGITTSPLHAGMPTDRLMAEWWLRSARVDRALRQGGQGTLGTQPGSPGDAPAGGGVQATTARIHVPGDIEELRRRDRPQALRVQGENREQFQHWFARGYAATGMERTAAGADYLLEPWSE